MKTDLIAEETRAVRRVVSGTHRTSTSFAAITAHPTDGRLLMHFGMSTPTSQWAAAPDLRELADLFTTLADALEAEKE